MATRAESCGRWAKMRSLPVYDEGRKGKRKRGRRERERERTREREREREREGEREGKISPPRVAIP